MNYINHATKISKLLSVDMSLNKKFDLCVIQRYLIKRFFKKLVKRGEN